VRAKQDLAQLFQVVQCNFRFLTLRKHQFMKLVKDLVLKHF